MDIEMIVNPNKMRASRTQFLTMIEFMERNGDISIHCGGPRKRHYNDLKWMELTDILNSDVSSGVSRSEGRWRKVWSDLKNNTKKKYIKIKNATSDPRRPALQKHLTDAEKRVLNVIQMQALRNKNELSSPDPSSPRVDHTIQSQVDHGIKFEVDQTVKSQGDHTIQSQVDHTLQSHVDHAKQSQVDHTIQSQEDHTIQSQEDHTIQSQVDHTIQSQEDHTIQSQVDHTIQPQEETNGNQKQCHENKKTYYLNLKDMKLLLQNALNKDEEDKRRGGERQKRRLLHDKEEPSVSKLKAGRNSNGLHEDFDEDKYFLLSLVPTLKQMTDDQRLMAKMKFLQVLQEVKNTNTSQDLIVMTNIRGEGTKMEYLDDDNNDSGY